MQYIVYKTTNLTNSKFYIGYHRTKDYTKFDGYFGSGNHMKRALKKYGKSNFVRETLVVFSNSEDALKFEHDYLNLIDYQNDPMCMNICHGGKGFGDWGVENKLGVHGASKEKLSEWGKKGWAKLKEEKIGIFSFTTEERIQMAKDCAAKRTPEERSRIASIGGEFGGAAARDKGLGIFAMTFEEKSERSKRTVANTQTPETQDTQGKLMGGLNKGSKVYNDGVRYYRYKKSEQEILSFDDFLVSNPQYKKGFPANHQPKGK